MRCYISGPMEGLEDENRRAFFAAEKQLRKKGWHVLNPAAMDVRSPIPDGLSYSELRRRYMKRDLNVIMDDMRADLGDVVFVLPGWTHSKGAKAEVALAYSLGMKVRPYREEERGEEDRMAV